MPITSDDFMVQVEHRMDSGIPADDVVNTFAARWDGGGAPGVADFQNLRSCINTFFLDLGNAVLAAPMLTGATTHGVKIYRLLDATPRVPVYENTFSVNIPVSSTGLPSEVAICNSFAADVASGQSAARRRGRVFLGPIASTASAAGTDGFRRPTNAVMQTIALASETLLDNMTLQSWTWCVWSRTGNELNPVVRGWVNDEFDTQRRRQPGPLTRVNWLAVP